MCDNTLIWPSHNVSHNLNFPEIRQGSPRTGLRGNSRSFVFAFHFAWHFSYFRRGRGGRVRVPPGNSRSFRLFNFFDVHFCGNSRTCGLAAVVVYGFRVVVLVVSGSSTSLMCIFRAKSRTFRWSGMVLNDLSSTSSMCIFRANSRTFRWSGMVLNGFCMVILVLFSSSTSSMCIFRGNYLVYRLFY